MEILFYPHTCSFRRSSLNYDLFFFSFAPFVFLYDVGKIMFHSLRNDNHRTASLPFIYVLTHIGVVYPSIYTIRILCCGVRNYFRSIVGCAFDNSPSPANIISISGGIFSAGKFQKSIVVCEFIFKNKNRAKKSKKDESVKIFVNSS